MTPASCTPRQCAHQATTRHAGNQTRRLSQP
jgi:hypothetical protein